MAGRIGGTEKNSQDKNAQKKKKSQLEKSLPDIAYCKNIGCKKSSTAYMDSEKSSCKSVSGFNLVSLLLALWLDLQNVLLSSHAHNLFRLATFQISFFAWNDSTGVHPYFATMHTGVKN